MKIVFMGTPEFAEASLQKLLETEHRIVDIENEYKMGFMTNDERYRAVVREWEKTTDDVTKAKLPPKPGADAAPAAPGAVSVTVDTIQAIPGALVSGSVTFSDGNKARWFFDQMGRFAFEPELPGYQPSAEDSRAFQTQLQAELSQRGY